MSDPLNNKLKTETIPQREHRRNRVVCSIFCRESVSEFRWKNEFLRM